MPIELVRPFTAAPCASLGLMPCIGRVSWRGRKSCSREAEAIQAEDAPAFPQLFSTQGFYYCDLLLTQCRATEVRERAAYSIEIAQSLRAIVLTRLSLGRAALALDEYSEAESQLDQAVDGLRQAGHIEFIVFGLLARAMLFRKTREFDCARCDLDEAMRIARRSEMRLFQFDAHLEYARLALAEGDKEVAEARRLVEETGYGRRRPEVEALEAEVR
jgi:tetratricopeptide (TPR) repeat protein